jgi:ketosteroid isomerase-like protein
MADEAGNAALAERFYRAIEARDYAGVEACYTPDAQLWHNIDGKTQTVAENLAEIRSVARRVASIRYDLERRIDFAGGFVQL